MSERGDGTPGYRIHFELAGLEDEFLRTIVGNTSEGLLTIDTDSTIVFANAAIEGILGYTPEELVGSSKLETIPERLRPVHEQQLAQYIRTGEKHINWGGVQLPALHKDGHEVPVTISLREHEFDGKRLFTGLFRDISDLKEKEDALMERNERLERFASVLSHDLRNPLTVAKSYTELLSEEVDRAELEEIGSALDRIDDLVDDMLTLTERTDDAAESRRSVSVAELASESWRWVDTADATLAVADDAGTVRANRSRVGSLFENLFNNAVEHGGSDVTVRVGRLDADDGFYVEDDGAGIPAGERDRILEHGFTTSPDGTGLGLSIVERIASEHGWSIDVTEGDDGGARFEFRV